MLRIIAGEFRSRLLETPPDAATRPMTDRVKESLFNLLRGWFEGATVLDLFAGVGTLGLEAISRGAAHAHMVERDRAIYRMLRRNIDELGCGDRVEAVQADALSAVALAGVRRPLDLIFIDPPYPEMIDDRGRRRVLEQAARCRGLMGDRGFLTLRTPLDPAEHAHEIPGFEGPEVHRYGQEMRVLLYAPSSKGGDPLAAARPEGGGGDGTGAEAPRAGDRPSGT
ncbi:MAG TPA: 16S rRNA (guanine(966)-N(2))-methyltransferase RsmD [Phycisphaerales bacterium]|nr:16S rRNA (guanine(966)-N(2))-methyltransferase RsmD [Phycisphaerales bacterium]HMP37722.1 16S rRNA (guanine(966)-N(2))-methyltransferase RsmD [Phycisphaerales bacterium]